MIATHDCPRKDLRAVGRGRMQIIFKTTVSYIRYKMYINHLNRRNMSVLKDGDARKKHRETAYDEIMTSFSTIFTKHKVKKVKREQKLDEERIQGMLLTQLH